MKTPIVVKNRLRTKSCRKSSKSTNCCCSTLSEKMRLNHEKMNEILLFLRENVLPKASMPSNEVRCDLQSSSNEFQKKVSNLPEPEFEVTYDFECSTSSKIENEIKESFVVDNCDFLQEASVTTPNEPKFDKITCEFDPLIVKHEPKILKGHQKYNMSKRTKDSTLSSFSDRKRKFDLISTSDAKKTSKTKTSSIAIDSNSQHGHRKKLKKSPTIKEAGLILDPTKNLEVPAGESNFKINSDKQGSQPKKVLDYQENMDPSSCSKENNSHESRHGQSSKDSTGKHSRDKKEDSSLDRYDKYPVYNNKTGARVDSKEVRTTIGENISKIKKNGERLFNCKIDHDCPRSFKNRSSIVSHIFCFFFLIQCPKCERKFNRTSTLSRHLKQYET